MQLQGANVPVPLLEMAMEAGLTDEAIVRCWAQYTAWHVKTYGAEANYRVKDWQRQIAFTKRDELEIVPTTAETRAIERREDARAVKAANDRVYAGSACTFPQWVNLLRQRDPSQLMPHERLVVEYARSLDGVQGPTLLGYFGWCEAHRHARGSVVESP